MVRDLTSGAILAVVAVAYSLAYAALIFTGPLAPGLAHGFGAALAASGLCALVVALTSAFPTAIAGPDAPGMAVLAVMAASAAAALGGDAPAVVPLLLAGTTVSVGVALTAFGALGLGRAIRFVPYPVVGGFLAGSGSLLLLGSVQVMTGLPVTLDTLPLFAAPAPLAHLLPGVILAASLLAATRWRSPLALPLMLLLGGLAAHGLLAAAGLSLDEARAAGWLLSVPTDAALPWPWLDRTALAALPGSAVLSAAGELAAVIAVTTVSLLMNAAGLEVETRTDADLNRELRLNGLANLLAGAAGGLVGNLQLNRTLLNRRFGGATRLSGVVVGVVCLALLATGSEVAGLIPTPLLGSLVMFSGLTLIDRWLIRGRRQMGRADFLVVLAIAVAIVRFGYLAGLALGVIAATLVFAIRYARIGAIKRTASGREYRSHVEWSPGEQAILRRHGDRIRVVWLHGFIFFGSANRLLEEARAWIERPAPGTEEGIDAKPARWLVLDLRQVSGLDSSAALTFARLVHLAEHHGAALALAALPPGVERALRAAGVLTTDPTVRLFPDLDRALEDAEARLIGSIAGRDHAVDRFHDWLAEAMGGRGLADRFVARLEPVEVAAGQTLIRQGEPSDELYFVGRGRVSVMLQPSTGGGPIRLRSMVDCTMVGEMGLYRGLPRGASVRADAPTLAYRLTRQALDRMETEDAATALAFHAMVVRLLAERLALANAEIAALEGQ